MMERTNAWKVITAGTALTGLRLARASVAG